MMEEYGCFEWWFFSFTYFGEIYPIMIRRWRRRRWIWIWRNVVMVCGWWFLLFLFFIFLFILFLLINLKQKRRRNWFDIVSLTMSSWGYLRLGWWKRLWDEIRLISKKESPSTKWYISKNERPWGRKEEMVDMRQIDGEL